LKFLPAELTLLDCFCEFLIARDSRFQYKPASNAVRFLDFVGAVSSEALQNRQHGHVVTMAASVTVE
jgi:hypothetical protein